MEFPKLLKVRNISSMFMSQTCSKFKCKEKEGYAGRGRNYLPFLKNSKLACNTTKVILVSILNTHITIYIICLQNSIYPINWFSIFHHISKVPWILVLGIAENHFFSHKCIKRCLLPIIWNRSYLPQEAELNWFPINLEEYTGKKRKRHKVMSEYAEVKSKFNQL